MEALNQWLAGRDVVVPTVFVTHQVNITALTGQFARSGELIIVRPEADGSVTPIGAIDPSPAY